MIRILHEKKHSGVTFKAGHFYTFKYRAFQHDPQPLIIFISAAEGINPKTGNQHRYIQGINLNYIPLRDRKRFLKEFRSTIDRTKNIKFTWNIIKKRYPYIAYAVRRYFYMPRYYIYDLSKIPEEAVQGVVAGSAARDFSKQIQAQLAAAVKGKKPKKRGTARGSR